jgi:hypothetical protein
MKETTRVLPTSEQVDDINERAAALGEEVLRMVMAADLPVIARGLQKGLMLLATAILAMGEVADRGISEEQAILEASFGLVHDLMEAETEDADEERAEVAA